MPHFGKQSLQILETVDPYLKEICHELVKLYDIKVISGFRTKEEQDKIVLEGRSKVSWPKSNHNHDRYTITQPPAMAVDIAPYPIDWQNTSRFVFMAGLFLGIAHERGTTVRWGGDWDTDGIILTDQKFDDLGHFELVV
jgi:peptidoglycan L-alanyl-D-glutamate endopeptidase CwlK